MRNVHLRSCGCWWRGGRETSPAVHLIPRTAAGCSLVMAVLARAIVAGWTESGTLVVVTHGANILPLTGVTPEEGGMVIVKPDPASTAKLRTLGQISPLPLGP